MVACIAFRIFQPLLEQRATTQKWFNLIFNGALFFSCKYHHVSEMYIKVENTYNSVRKHFQTTTSQKRSLIDFIKIVEFCLYDHSFSFFFVVNIKMLVTQTKRNGKENGFS